MSALTFDTPICCDIRHVTKKAILIYDGTTEAWIPLSQLDKAELPPWEGEVLEAVDVWMTEWIATEKGLI